MLWSFALLVVAIVGIAASSALLGRYFEQVVDIQFADHHDEWVAIGRPAGGQITRSEQSFWLSGFSAPLVAQKWLFTPPEWARTHSLAAQALRRMRFAFAVLLVSSLLALGAGFFFVITLMP